MGDVERELRRAREAIRAARKLVVEGLCDDAANRLCYAAFHAVRAMLWRAEPGMNIRTHRGAMTLLGRELVVRGRAPEGFSVLLSELSSARERADYAGGNVECAWVRQRLPEVQKMISHAAGGGK